VDTEALFLQINNDYKNSIKRICFSYEKNEAIANELFQEIMVAIWQSLSSFKGDSSIKTWVYRVAYNKSITHVGKEARRKEYTSLEDIEGSIEDRISNDQVEDRNLIEFIQTIINKLDPIDKEIFTLYLEGEKQKEIALISGLAETSISTKISRIKKIILDITKGDQNE
jgi:RNA polymerase sigma factor (sigma-70 family)